MNDDYDYYDDDDRYYAANNKGMANTLSSSDIARMTGMRPSAVTNWRKRSQKHFPDPVGSKNGRPLFDYDAVRVWLDKNGIKYKDMQLEQGVWTFLESWRENRDPEEAASQMLWAMCLLQLVHEYGLRERWNDLLTDTDDKEDLSAVGSRLDASVERILEGAGYSEYGRLRNSLIRTALRVPDDMRAITMMQVRDLLQYVSGLFWSDSSRINQLATMLLERSIVSLGRSGGEGGTPESRVSNLLASMAASYWQNDLNGKDGLAVYDPACGVISTYLSLVDAAKQHGCQTPTIYCTDAAAGKLPLAARRLMLAGVLNRAEFVVDDKGRGVNALGTNPFPKLEADIVTVEPPAITEWKPNNQDPRWRYSKPERWSKPVREDASLAWIQDAISHLNENGRAFVVTGAGPLQHVNGEEEWFRKRLIEDGCVEAIIALPPNMYVNTVAPMFVWVLSAPQERDHVIMVDATSKAGLYRSEGDLPTYLKEPLRRFADDNVARNAKRRVARRDGRDGGRDGDGDVAESLAVCVVKVSDMPKRRHTLIPEMWLKRKSPKAGTLAERYRATASALVDAVPRAEQALAELRAFDGQQWNCEGVPLVRLGDIAQIRVGTVPGAERDGLDDDVIRASDVRDYMRIGCDDRVGFYHEGRFLARPMTPDDTMWNGRYFLSDREDLLVTVSSGVNVLIDQDGRHRVSKSVYCVSLKGRSSCGVFNPEYVALMLQAEWNQELAKNFAGRHIRPADLEIPAIPIEQQTKLVAYWWNVETLRQQAALYERQFGVLGECCRFGVALGADGLGESGSGEASDDGGDVASDEA